MLNLGDWAIAAICIIAILVMICIPLGVFAKADEGIPLWRMPAGTRRVVVCEGERLAVHPINPTQILLWCVSPLATPGLPPRPPTLVP